MNMTVHNGQNERGAVLIIVLALVVLLSALIVAYFSRSMSDRRLSDTSFNQSKADELARSSLDIITGDLKQEIVNGSTVVAPVPAAGSTHYSSVYQPIAAANAIPVQNGQAGSSTTLPNLIRISSTTAIASPGADHAASALLSTTASANGRSISLARWNKHYLLPLAGTADSTPITGTGGFTAPGWVFVTTNGPSVITAPTKAVLGRYAYAIYDEGGLLDVNTAGYPSSSTTSQIGGKGASLGYADLTQLTDSSGNPLLTSAQIDQLVGWRNYASVQPSGSFGSFGMSTANATSYFNYLSSTTNGFLSVGPATLSGKTDQAVLSRQELLTLQGSIGFPAAALQYLGTFSREVNAPTFSYPATGTSGLAANDPTTNTINLNILSLRMATAGKALDGFSWNAGDPLVPRRFSLTRLAWLTYEGPSADLPTSDPLYNATGTDAAIQAFFGLQWVAASSQWNYVGPTSSTIVSSIETLTQVATETTPREPNFFELLKAAIHRDSLGVGVGTTTSSNSWVGNGNLIDNLADLQILRIGANMIDQSDADSYPTTIAYAPSGPSTPLYAYGIEDLPYINTLAFRSVANTDVSGFTDNGTLNHILYDEVIPVLWNPHRTINATTGVPAKIQLYMTGQSSYLLLGGYQAISGTTSTLSKTTTNDTVGYTSGTNSRLNWFGPNSSSLTANSVPAAQQNTGSIIIDKTQFFTFANPNLISVNPVSGVAPTATGAYGSVPNAYTTGVAGASSSYGIMGLTLTNLVFSAGRQAQAYDFQQPNTSNPTAWNGNPRFDGYYSINPGGIGQSSHHINYLGKGSVGLNVVLRYQGFDGAWHVYNAFASNEAEPGGTVPSNYDVYGLCVSGTSGTASGVNIADFGTQSFPAYLQTPSINTNAVPVTIAAADPNWNSSGGTLNATRQPPFQDNRSDNDYYLMKSDPRTARFSLFDYTNGTNVIDWVRASTDVKGQPSAMGYSLGYVTTPAYVSDLSGSTYPGMWAQNATNNGAGTYVYDWDPGHTSLATKSQTGKVRPGDDYFNGVLAGTNYASKNNIYQTPDARPVVLNRPFRNVGELGYVFRDNPYKSLDMSSSLSVDAALLDFFTVDAAQTPIIAGKVDINTRQSKVLQSVLNGSFRVGDPTGIVSMGSAAAATIAGNIVSATETTPLLNKAQLVTSLGTSPNQPNTTSTIFDGDTAAAVYPSIKTQREAPVRALADVANTRTWNLLIDVIAQTGQYPPGTTDLSQFVVTGERRYWLHVAIDRYTGKVVDQQLEPVYE